MRITSKTTSKISIYWEDGISLTNFFSEIESLANIGFSVFGEYEVNFVGRKRQRNHLPISFCSEEFLEKNVALVEGWESIFWEWCDEDGLNYSFGLRNSHSDSVFENVFYVNIDISECLHPGFLAAALDLESIGIEASRSILRYNSLKKIFRAVSATFLFGSLEKDRTFPDELPSTIDEGSYIRNHTDFVFSRDPDFPSKLVLPFELGAMPEGGDLNELEKNPDRWWQISDRVQW